MDCPKLSIPQTEQGAALCHRPLASPGTECVAPSVLSKGPQESEASLEVKTSMTLHVCANNCRAHWPGSHEPLFGYGSEPILPMNQRNRSSALIEGYSKQSAQSVILANWPKLKVSRFHRNCKLPFSPELKVAGFTGTEVAVFTGTEVAVFTGTESCWFHRN